MGKLFTTITLALSLAACAGKPRQADANWSTLNGQDGKPLAAFSNKGEIEFYSSAEEAMKAMLGVVGNQQKEIAELKDKKKPKKADKKTVSTPVDAGSHVSEEASKAK